MVKTAVSGCHFQIICFGLKVGLEEGWARLDFKVSIVVFFLGFIQWQEFLLSKKMYPIVDRFTTFQRNIFGAGQNLHRKK